MSSFENELHPKAVQDFGLVVSEVLNGVAFNENEAVDASIVGLVTGGNVLFSGPPGGSKTNLAKGVLALFADLDREDFAIIPAQSDLSPERLVGGHMSNTKTVQGEEGSYKEETGIEIPGIIRPNTAIIFADELNRTNPLAINAALPVFAEKTLVNTAGRFEMPRFVMSLLTMNPSERRSGTFEVVAAMASRASVGAIIGDPAAKTRDDRRNTISKIAQEDEPDFDAIPKLIDTSTLARMRLAIQRNMAIPSNDTVTTLLEDVVMGSIDGLRDMGYREADGRFARQVTANAKAIAALNAKPVVDEFSVKAAGKFVAAARLSATSHRAYEQIPEIHQMIDSL